MKNQKPSNRMIGNNNINGDQLEHNVQQDIFNINKI